MCLIRVHVSAGNPGNLSARVSSVRVLCFFVVVVVVVVLDPLVLRWKMKEARHLHFKISLEGRPNQTCSAAGCVILVQN